MLSSLNSEQRIAAETFEGPLLILAGAGTGKTKTVTYRIAYMLAQGVDPSSILAVTFTNKAAKEMRERVKALVGKQAEIMQISTFHSFGVQLLKQYATQVGLSSSFTIYDSDDQKKIITQVTKEQHLIFNETTPGQLVSRIAKVKESGQESLQELEKSRFPRDIQFVKLYHGYQLALRRSNAVDFADILLYSLELIKQSDVLSALQSRFQFVMVDEYQDTNHIQYEIITRIASKHKNLCVVGDEDQSIYRFRGADITNILNFEKDYPNAKVIKLEQNYRSTQIILKAANAVIHHNLSSKGKQLWSQDSTNEKIKWRVCDSDREEASSVTHSIRSLASVEGCAILYRTNFQSRIMEEELRRHHIPYKIYGGMQFYQRAEIKDILGYLKVIFNPHDELNLLRVINTPARGIGETSLEKLREISRQKEITFFEALSFVSETTIRAATAEKIKTFYHLLTQLREEQSGYQVSEIIREVFEKSGYKNFLKESDEQERLLNIEELIHSAQELEKEEIELDLETYLEYVSLAMSSDGSNDQEPHVQLMTIHSAKGLEFENVFLIGFEEEIFPGTQSRSEEDIEEERRLCYVAITRAKKRLWMSMATTRRVHGMTTYYRQPSSFFQEIPSVLLEVEQNSLMKRHSFTSHTAQPVKEELVELYKKIEVIGKYRVGMSVTHKTFGPGKVTKLDEEKISINFQGMGEKKFLTRIIEKFLVE